MNTIKILLLSALTIGVYAAQVTYNRVAQLEVESSLALEQFADPSLATSVASQNHANVADNAFLFCYIVVALLGVLFFRTQIRNLLTPAAARNAALALVVCGALGSSGCRKPYHEKLYVDVGTSEIAILVETMNDEGQAVVTPPGKGEGQKADGTQVNYYADRVVNAKRVEIPYFWKQTSRVYLKEHAGNGKWAPAARLLVVDTSPCVRQWHEGKDAIWVESSDSVGFSTGFSVTGRIENQEDALKFLSNYPPKGSRQVVTEGGDPFNVEITSLNQIMDTEVRQKIQTVYADESTQYEMDDLRGKKKESIDAVREIVIPYFKERGITLTSIGQFGGFTYENPEIQKSIDAVFKAQQDRAVAIAETEAAGERKSALKLVGEGEAAKAIERANGEAEAIKLKATAEAEAIKAVADAKSYELQKLAENPEAYIQLKQLEIELERVNTWDGSYPQTLLGGEGGGAVPLLNLGK